MYRHSIVIRPVRGVGHRRERIRAVRAARRRPRALVGAHLPGVRVTLAAVVCRHTDRLGRASVAVRSIFAVIGQRQLRTDRYRCYHSRAVSASVRIAHRNPIVIRAGRRVAHWRERIRAGRAARRRPRALVGTHLPGVCVSTAAASVRRHTYRIGCASVTVRSIVAIVSQSQLWTDDHDGHLYRVTATLVTNLHSVLKCTSLVGQRSVLVSDSSSNCCSRRTLFHIPLVARSSITSSDAHLKGCHITSRCIQTIDSVIAVFAYHHCRIYYHVGLFGQRVAVASTTSIRDKHPIVGMSFNIYRRIIDCTCCCVNICPRSVAISRTLPLVTRCSLVVQVRHFQPRRCSDADACYRRRDVCCQSLPYRHRKYLFNRVTAIVSNFYFVSCSTTCRGS